MNDHVKICPTCGTENSAVAQRCVCGAFLIGVDVVERRPPEAAVAMEPASAPPQGAVVIAEPDPASVAPAPAADPPAPPPPAEVSVPTAVADPAAAPAEPAASGLLLCPHEDCAQPNPPGSTTCLYCNRPFAAEPAPPAVAAPVATRATTAPRRTASGNTTPGGGRRSLVNLPAALAERVEIIEPLKAAGGEADLFIVHDRERGCDAVLKLYRHGVEPKTDVLERVSRGAPDQVVALFDFGVADGVPYELLEYCEHGSLRSLLKGRPIPSESVRTILTELAEAIDHLHGHGIVHRDLKPENVLVRGLLPLDLVLTDFGISSVAQATMHFTSAARTLRYAAPETGSNWVGKPSDYWSLGMMLAEALAGRHPYEGLSEAVIAHQLVTKAVDLSGVKDERWRLLCRGLLARDPSARWGAAEITRWLAGDDSLAVADEPAAAGMAEELRPYRIEGEECRTPRELGAALARHWSTAAQDLRRGILRSWVQNDLRDQQLTRFLVDIEEDPATSHDEKLVRLLQRLDPALPPIFQGYDVSRAGLVALTASALAADGEIRQLVCGVLERGTLKLFALPELHEVQEAYQAACAQAAAAMARARAAGAPASLKAEGREWELQLFAAVIDPAASAVAELRAHVATVAAGAARRCAWYTAIADPATASAAELAVLVIAGPAAVRNGMDAIAGDVRAAVARIDLTVSGNDRLAGFAARVESLRASIDTAADEQAALRLPVAAAELESEVTATLDGVWEQEVFVARRVSADEHLRPLRARISAYARQRAGDAYSDFGERIEIVAAIGRRAYTVRLDTQIESRRSPYKYSESDRARMPAAARATAADPWACAMPALPCHAADFRMGGATQVRCARCGQVATVKLNEAWGSKSFLFATVFACHDKVGLQIQSRSVTSEERVRPPFVPVAVADLVESLATEETSPDRTVEVVYPRIDDAVLEAIPDGPVKEACRGFVAEAMAESDDEQRITAQRLRLRWSGVTEVRYRHEGRDWVMWVPARVDRKPIDPESPLPKEPPRAGAEPQAVPVPVAEPAPMPVREPVARPVLASVEPLHPPARRASSGSSWLRHLAIWGAIILVLWIALKSFLH
jgi:hypothetical protein